MRIGRNEIIEELTEHIRRCGGEPSEWCVGTAVNSSGIQDGGFNIQDETQNALPKLAYREALTPYTAADAVEYLVSAFGLRPAANSAPGKIVFVRHGMRERVGTKL